MAEIENTENTEVSKSGNGMLRLPYAIAKNKGLSTENMTPRQVWEMLKGKGISKEAEEKKFLDSQKTGIKDEPRDEPEQLFDVDEDWERMIAQSEKDDYEKMVKENKEYLRRYALLQLPYRRINSAKKREWLNSEAQKYEKAHNEARERANPNFTELAKINEKYRTLITEAENKRKPPIELPTLRGSEKQTAWADEIRVKMAESLEGLVETLHDIPRAMELAEQSIKNKSVHNAFNRNRITELIDLKNAIKVLKETDATWFIDNR